MGCQICGGPAGTHRCRLRAEFDQQVAEGAPFLLSQRGTLHRATVAPRPSRPPKSGRPFGVRLGATTTFGRVAPPC